MKYMGSKSRHAKYIVPILNQYHKDVFIDACTGGANIIDKMSNNIRIGYDVNEYLIALLDAASKGWLPPDKFTEDEYYYVKSNKDENPVLTGYVGFSLSYGGKWFGGWRRDNTGKRDYVLEAYRNALKQFPKLYNVEFKVKSLFDIDVNDCLIYVDPPYLGTTRYRDSFNHNQFYDWCRCIGKNNNLIISEYWMPDDFKCIWERDVVSSLTLDTGSKKNKEKLFILEK